MDPAVRVAGKEDTVEQLIYPPPPFWNDGMAQSAKCKVVLPGGAEEPNREWTNKRTVMASQKKM